MRIAIVIVAIILINIIFGYWRANTRKFTIPWILAIHVPVPLAIGLRLWLLGWNWALIPVFVAAFALGQFIGGLIRGRLKKSSIQLTSFLFTDIFRLLTVKNRDE